MAQSRLQNNVKKGCCRTEERSPKKMETSSENAKPRTKKMFLREDVEGKAEEREKVSRAAKEEESKSGKRGGGKMGCGRG